VVRGERRRLFIAVAVLVLLGLGLAIRCEAPSGAGGLLPPPAAPQVAGLVPAVYDLDVSLDPASGTLRGESRVEYTNNEEVPLGELYFHLYPNAAAFARDVARPGRLTVQGVRLGEHPARWEARATQLKVALPQPLAPGEKAELTLTWELTVPAYPGRLGENDGIISLGNWYPILAVYDAAGWHLDPYYERGDPFYSEVARYKVRLALPDAYQAAATGNLRAVRNLPGPTKELTWESGLVRDFALAISSDYQALRTRAGEVLVQSYFPKEERDGGRRVLAAGRDALEFFSCIFGSYPYDQFTLAATGFYQGGMEYPNIVFLARQFYGPADADVLEYVAVHETAHQWWYGVVGNNQVEEAWLDEGLAEFSTLLFFEKVRGRTAAGTQSLLSLYAAYRQAEGDGVVLQRLDAFPSDLAYNALVYGKGCLLFIKLREEVGEETLLKILRTYYQRFAYRTATSRDFIRVAEEVSGQDLSAFFHRWLESAGEK